MTTQIWLTLGLIILIGLILAITGLTKRPTLGIIVAAVIIGVAVGLNHIKVIDLGFSTPKNWPATILWGLGIGLLLSFLSLMIIAPAAEKMVNQPLDLILINKVRGNWKQLAAMLLVGGILSSFFEESIFRGFLMSGLGALIGKNGVFASIGLLISAIIFGLAHWNQGKSGAISAAILGLLLGDVFIWSGYNLWLPIITHVVVNIVSTVLVYFNQDTALKRILWKENA